MKFGRDVDIAILDVGPIDFLFEAVAIGISCDGQSKWVPETVILRSSSSMKTGHIHLHSHKMDNSALAQKPICWSY